VADHGLRLSGWLTNTFHSDGEFFSRLDGVCVEITPTLSSPAVKDGGQIPARYGYRAANVNPPLAIGGVPEGTAALALVVDDPDAVAPAGTAWDHWLVWDLDSARESIPADWEAEEATEAELTAVIDGQVLEAATLRGTDAPA
jgi:phosphatidylethanolamine-binding protein (PEBP) family uncharacterized protein